MTPLEIVVMNDQLFPINETDAEQIFQAMSAVGGEPDVQVSFLLPAAFRRTSAGADDLAAFYEVTRTFEVCHQKSLFPSVRAIEKIGHGLFALSNPIFKRADVVYSRNLPTVLSVLAFSDKPVVYETFRPWPDQQPVLTPVLKWMVARPRFLGAVTHSSLAKASFVTIGLPEEKGLVAYNGYNPRLMQPVLSKAAARKQLGLPMDTPIVTYAGHVNMDKGLGIMLRLAGRMPNVHFIIVGSEGEGAVERAGRELANVRFVKWQPFSATVPYMYASDVLFIPPTAGPLTKVGNTVLPIKTFLYMASERAIFGPATPDLREVLEHDRNAVLVPPDDEEAAFQGLSTLLEKPRFRNRIAKTAKEDVSALTWEARAARIVSFIKDHLEKSGLMQQ